MDQQEKNKAEVLENIEDLKLKVESMSPECFADYSLYFEWVTNTRELIKKSVSYYSGTGAPATPPPT